MHFKFQIHAVYTHLDSPILRVDAEQGVSLVDLELSQLLLLNTQFRRDQPSHRRLLAVVV